MPLWSIPKAAVFAALLCVCVYGQVSSQHQQSVEPGKPFRVSQLTRFPRADQQIAPEAKVVKLEVFANGERICIDDSPRSGFSECVWHPLSTDSN